MPHRRKFITISTVFATALFFYFLHLADHAQRASVATSSLTPSPPASGTWLNDTGAVFQFRPDGTGRSRDPQLPASPVHYFEWEFDGATLTIHYVPSGRIMNFLAYQTGHATAEIAVTTQTRDEIVGTLDGVETRFTTTMDSVLDAAP